jgi:hypothetical protein
MMNLRNPLTLMILTGALFCMACAGGPLRLNMEADRLQGLEPGTDIVLGSETIGEVTHIATTSDQGYRIKVQIAPAHRHQVTEHSVFTITPGSRNQKTVSVVVTNSKEGGALLKNGAVVKARTAPTGVAAQMRDSVSGLMNALTRRYKGFAEQLRSLPDTYEFQRLEDEFKALAKKIGDSGIEGRERFKREVLPIIRQEIDQLKERFRESGREGDFSGVEEQIKILQTL